MNKTQLLTLEIGCLIFLWVLVKTCKCSTVCIFKIWAVFGVCHSSMDSKKKKKKRIVAEGDAKTSFFFSFNPHLRTFFFPQHS